MMTDEPPELRGAYPPKMQPPEPVIGYNRTARFGWETSGPTDHRLIIPISPAHGIMNEYAIGLFLSSGLLIGFFSLAWFIGFQGVMGLSTTFKSFFVVVTMLVVGQWVLTLLGLIRDLRRPMEPAVVWLNSEQLGVIGCLPPDQPQRVWDRSAILAVRLEAVTRFGRSVSQARLLVATRDQTIAVARIPWPTSVPIELHAEGLCALLGVSMLYQRTDSIA